jgi:hypothetical protein
MKKKKNPFSNSKYCYRRKHETRAKHRHRLEIEKEIIRLLQKSEAWHGSWEIPDYYTVPKRKPITQEALKALATQIVFRPEVISYHGHRIWAHTRQTLVDCVSDPQQLTIDWCIYRPGFLWLSAEGIVWINMTQEQAHHGGLDDVYEQIKKIGGELRVRCRCKLIWYLLNYRSTPVLLPGDKGVLRNIIGFIL